MRLSRILLLGGAALCFVAPSAGRSADKDTILVDQLDVKGSSVVAMRAFARIEALPERVVTVLGDAQNANQWMPMVNQRFVVQQLSPSSRIEYTGVVAPWPVADRYFVTKTGGERLPKGGYKLYATSVPSSGLPLASGAVDSKVEGEVSQSVFTLKPALDGNATVLEIEVHMDPKGHLPAWMVNWAQRDWPVQFVEGLREQVKRTNADDRKLLDAL